MLKETIINNWRYDIRDNAQRIHDQVLIGYSAWTVKTHSLYGVAVPCDNETKVNESFASAKIQNMIIRDETDNKQTVLALLSSSEGTKQAFAALCKEFIDPGEGGTNRTELLKDPLSWWKEWKELLGNKNIDKRIYDTLGELVVFKYALGQNEEPVWGGPDGATYDIETDSRFIEVKSSINKSHREATISSQFQLFPREKPLSLVLCRFEPMVKTGISIDGILEDIRKIGYNVSILNSKLEALGFEKEMSSRRKKFILHEMLLYKIDDSFPRITPESFAGGVMPEGITKITYTVDLSGLESKSLIQGEDNDI